VSTLLPLGPAIRLVKGAYNEPASVAFPLAYFSGPHRFEPVPLVFLGVWVVHYANRGFFFPLSKK